MAVQFQFEAHVHKKLCVLCHPYFSPFTLVSFLVNKKKAQIKKNEISNIARRNLSV